MKLLTLWRHIRGSFWYLPALYSLVAFILAILTIRFDFFLSARPDILKYVPNLLLSDKGLAQTVLGSISSALLTMTTITFSSILVVLTTFLSNFSPRTLQNFITDHSTQRVLGSFVGGFVYSVILLLLLRETEEKTTFLSPSFAILVTIICLAAFIFFVHHTSNWIQVGHLIFRISSETKKVVEEKYSINETVEVKREEYDFESHEKHDPILIKAPETGYIEVINEAALLEVAVRNNGIIRIEKKQADFVNQGSPLFSVWNMADEGLENELSTYFSIGPTRSPYHNVEFGLKKLVEIALRAISPAVNDPNTAVNCIEQIGSILEGLGQKQLPKPLKYDKQGNLRLITKQLLFSDYLYLSFYQIRHYGQEDISIIRAILKALTVIAETNDSTIKNTVWEFTAYILEGIQDKKLISLDRRYLNDLLLILAKACKRQHEFKVL
ncbi:DUF2254 domain-containing protein [Neobacillus sp. SAB-20_R2A]|uniref:DUF2254 domain-containing protein n=1 Tax=Neobacillus sp. SAB-20_R2A TaxID=3120519 RepID=UPI003C6DF9B0